MNKKIVQDTPVTKWLQARDFRNNRSWRFTPDGELTTMVGTKRLTAKEFDKKYPVKTPLHFYQGNPENPDKTKSFMYDN